MTRVVSREYRPQRHGVRPRRLAGAIPRTGRRCARSFLLVAVVVCVWFLFAVVPVAAVPTKLTVDFIYDFGGDGTGVVRSAPAEGLSNVYVRVRLNDSAPSNGTIVTLTFEGSATYGDDYTVSPNPFTIATGFGSGVVPMTVVDDNENEGAESVFVTATSTNPVLSGSHGTSIADNEPPGRLALTPSRTSLAEGHGPLAVLVALNNRARAGGVTVKLTTSGTATAGTDYTLSARTVTIIPGDTSRVVMIRVIDDAVDDPDETVVLNATATATDSSQGGALMGSLTAALRLTIADNDARVTPTTVSLSASPNPVAEGSPVVVTARLSSALANDVTIPVTLSSGSADQGDYGTLSGITIRGGATSGTGTITTAQDTDAADESFTVALGTLPASVTAGSPASVVVTITDDDGTAPVTPAVSLSASPNPVAEGSPVVVTARLSSALANDVTIPVTLSSGSAEQGDYGTLSGITIRGGATSGTGTITTAQDTDAADESFTVALGTLPASVTAGSPASVVVTITDDDGTAPVTPAVSLSASPNPVAEGSPVVVTARLSSALANDVTIPVTLSSGSAEQGDYGTLSGITIRGGATSGTGTITTAQDTDAADESFTVALGTLPASVTAGSPASVVVTITDDDGTAPVTPAVSLSASPNPVAEGSPVVVTARLSSALANDVTIPVTLSSGSAEQGDYGTLSGITIRGGATSGTGTITTAQDTDAADESFTVALGTLPASVTAGSPASVVVTITDDDGTAPVTPAVSLSASPNPVAEGSPVVVTARLSSALANDVTIPVTLSSGSAEQGDYGTLSGITIRGGATSGTGTITTAQDTDAADESFTVALGTLPASVTAGSPASVVVTITDDDGTAPVTPAVSLSASPNPVAEGLPVVVTARLSSALANDVTIPVTLSSGSAEQGDYGTLSGITIRGGATSGTGTITTAQDTDAADESFTVALGTLPASVTAGSPASVVVTITDADGPGTETPPVAKTLGAAEKAHVDKVGKALLGLDEPGVYPPEGAGNR